MVFSMSHTGSWLPVYHMFVTYTMYRYRTGPKDRWQIKKLNSFLAWTSLKSFSHLRSFGVRIWWFIRYLFPLFAVWKSMTECKTFTLLLKESFFYQTLIFCSGICRYILLYKYVTVVFYINIDVYTKQQAARNTFIVEVVILILGIHLYNIRNWRLTCCICTCTMLYYEILHWSQMICKIQYNVQTSFIIFARIKLQRINL